MHALSLLADHDAAREGVLETIRDADEPLTRRDIVLETHRSEGKVHHALNDLRERGHVRRFRDEDDGRIYRYEAVVEVPADD